MMLIKKYSVNDFLQQFKVLDSSARILNVGSADVRYGEHCVNIDVQDKENVDYICDMHNLPESLGKFDVIICNGVLQYSHTPKVVAAQFYKVLNEDGYLFVDSPWIQPYCLDTDDKYRFSKDALRDIFSNFKVLNIDSSINTGSALVFLAMKIAKNLTPNKYLNYFLSKFVGFILLPFCWLTTMDESYTAGAFYIICQKKKNKES